jgi:5,10-methylenetetrahydromethanopterin reductase
LRIDVILDAGLPSQEVTTLGKLADDLGIHTLWGSCFASRRDPFLTLAPLGPTTQQLRLGVMPISPYEVHPLRIADGLLTFNEISQGRAAVLIGGLGHSTMRVTGLKPLRRITAVRDCVAILTGVSSSDSLNYEGEVFQLTDYSPEWATGPRPLVYVGANGPQMLRMAASIADGIMMSDVPLPRMAEISGHIQQGLETVGRSRRDFRLNNFFAWHIKPNAAESLAEARQGLIWRGFLQDWHISPFLSSEECQLVQDNRNSFLDTFLNQLDHVAGVPDTIVDKLVRNLTFAGDHDGIDVVIEHLQRFSDAGLDEVALKVHGQPAEAIRTIGERLVPALAA